MKKILWITPAKGYSPKEKLMIEMYLIKHNISRTAPFYFTMNDKKIGGPLIISRTKTKQQLNERVRENALKSLRNIISVIKPAIVVCNDLGALWLFTNNENYTLNLCRGSIYRFQDLPVLILDNLYMIHNVTEGSWIFNSDISKLGRWLNGKQRQQPKFHYRVARTVEDVREFADNLNAACAIAIDIETSRDRIACIGYAAIFLDGHTYNYVIPLINSLKENCCHWETEEDELEVWRLIKQIHRNDAYKIMQNGASYDAQYFIRYRIPLSNYYFDTLHLFHSLWTEAPKSLAFVSSILLDFVRYWKDEIKGDSKEKAHTFPQNEQSLEQYWRYNALDCYYTLFSCVYLLMYLQNEKLAWAVRNYNTEFRLAIGPCLFASIHGLYVDRNRQTTRFIDYMDKHETAKSELRIAVDDPQFNANSSDQVGQLLYDLIGAKVPPIKGKLKGNSDKPTDERILKLVKFDNWLAAFFINKIWEVKKALNQASKYGQMRLYNNRLMYTLDAAGTETGRLASKAHAFWYGTNAQNIPADIRNIVLADPGYVLYEADYSQSDAVFVAYESQDPEYMKTMDPYNPIDTHSKHASFFFQIPYADICKAAKEKLPWAVHPTEGVRQNTKRVVHGANFQMQAGTLVSVMGLEACISSLKALSIWKPSLSFSQIVTFMDNEFLKKFHILYPGLAKWFTNTAALAIRNQNKIVCAFGRTRLFFGDISKDAKIQREISAYYGQGGTAGNVNRVMNEIYWNRQEFMQDGVRIVLQVHDSLMFLIPIDHVKKYAPLIKEIMEEEFDIHGRTIRINTDAKIGLSWGNGMVDYEEGWYKQVEKAELKINNFYTALNERLNSVDQDVNEVLLDIPDETLDTDEPVEEIDLEEME